jgi:hypothetical protein
MQHRHKSHPDEAPRSRRLERLARGLGWLGIGLGLAELLLPRAVARSTGLRGRETLLQVCGLRELATGLAILNARDPTPWVWGRVAGDALDLATLGSALDEDNPRRAGTAAALAAVAGVAALDVACARALSTTTRALARRYDSSDRSGLPLPAAEMRGAALDDFEAPDDMRTPQALRPQLLH